MKLQMMVVICLKTRTFAVSQTTIRANKTPNSGLWFAWKLVLLQYRKQPTCLRVVQCSCCDLLENSYFCSIANNGASSIGLLFLVVICLKTRTFAVSQTTITARAGIAHGLWFAWKLVLLQYRKQLAENPQNWLKSCDLLENSYFCSIANNHITNLSDTEIVVICLKTRTFAVSQTTFHLSKFLRYMLWFAWKLVLLQYRKQLIKRMPKLGIVVICLKTRTFAVSQTTATG